MTGEPLTPVHLSEQLLRLAAIFGEPKAKSDELMLVMAKEWHAALKGFGVKTVALAVTKHARESKWWPTLAEIVALCRAEDNSWRDALGLLRPSGLPEFKSAPVEKLPQEVLDLRAAALNRMKAEYGYSPETSEVRIGDDLEVKASQDQTVSPNLMRTCAVRRSLGLPTCRHDCANRNCNLRESA